MQNERHSVNDPEQVRVVMAEICEQITMKCLCIEVCELCPLNDAEWENIDKMRDLFDKYL